jgi:hypothetical protein
LNFQLSAEQIMLRDQMHRFVDERFSPADRAGYTIPEAGHNAANWSLLADLGLLALPFASDCGGLGGAAEDIMVVSEVFGRGVVPEPLLSEILLAGAVLARAGTVAQKQRWLPAIMAGDAHLALAFAETGMHFDFEKASTVAKAGKLYGSKTFVMAGAACNAFIVTATANDRLGLYLVATNAPGLTKRSYRLIDGAPAYELEFAATPAEALAGTGADLSAVVDEARIAISAELVGLMSLLLETTLDYVKVRKQFGAPIGSFQAIQHRLADLYVSVEQSRSLLYRAALAPHNERASAGIAAKSYISAAAVRLGEEAIQLHGGMGVTEELIIGHAHKRVLLLASLFGDADSEAQRYLSVTTS